MTRSNTTIWLDDLSGVKMREIHVQGPEGEEKKFVLSLGGGNEIHLGKREAAIKFVEAVVEQGVCLRVKPRDSRLSEGERDEAARVWS